MNPFHPRNFEEEAHGEFFGHHRDSITKGNLWSAIAAYAEDISYSYEYIQQFVSRQNSRGSGYVEEDYPNLPTPTRLEFLEILEFREKEIHRALTEHPTDPNWQWPSDWKASWNSYIIHEKDKEAREFDLCSTQSAIAIQKCLLGENVSVELDWYTRTLIANLYNLFFHHGGFRALPAIIPVVISFDLPVDLKPSPDQDKQRFFDIDDVLGQYAIPGGGRQETVRLFVRAISQCADQLSLNEYHLKNIVILHELSHWLVHLFAHYPIKNPIDDREDLLSAWYKNSDSTVHEAWAQLLTYFVVHGLTGVGITFEKLLKNQSPNYHKFKDVLHVCDDVKIVLDSLIAIREGKKPVSFNEWMNTLESLKG